MRTSRVLLAFLRRDLRIQRSYRLQALGQFATLGMGLATYTFLSRIVPGHQLSLRPYGFDYFSFVLIGSAASLFFTAGLSGFSETLGREQATGTLEALLVTPHDARLLLASGGVWAFALAALQAVVYVTVGTLFLHAHVAPAGFVLVIAMTLLSLAIFSALGLLAAATIIQTKRGGTLLGFAASAFALLGGVFYPLSVLPGWLQTVAHGLPMSYALDGVRRAAISSSDLTAIGLDALVLMLYAAFLVPLAFLASGWSIDRARVAGSLAQY